MPEPDPRSRIRKAVACRRPETPLQVVWRLHRALGLPSRLPASPVHQTVALLARRSAALVVLAVLAAPAWAQPEADVRTAFARYRAAVLARDGTAALAVVSRSTIDHYALMQDLALDGDSAAVAARPFMDRLLILSLRHRLLPSDLRRLTGVTALMYGVKRGWIDAEAMRTQGIGEVEIEGDLAVGGLTQDGAPLGDVWLRFVREGGEWRLDLTSIFDSVSHAFDRLAQEEDVDLTASIVTMLESVTGRPVPESVWDPVGR